MDIYQLNFTSLDQKVFTFLCIRAGESFSQREISIYLNVSPTAIGNSIRNLKKLDFVEINIAKTINFITLNRDNPFVINLKRVENLKQIYMSHLFETLEETFAGSSVILFGSYSKGEDSINSDIDIAIIGRNKKNVDLTKYEKKLNRKIILNFYPNFNKIHEHLRNNILNGIVLCGSIEL